MPDSHDEKGREVKMSYDSTDDTFVHINSVRALLSKVRAELGLRGDTHDMSKLENPEKAVFDEYTPKLRDTTYGSDEYKEFLKGMQVGLKHHYANNSHHPEHFENGMAGMNLVDLIEMFCDWMAAVQRHANGDIHKSIDINKERFGYDDMMASIFHNTVKISKRQQGGEGG